MTGILWRASQGSRMALYFCGLGPPRGPAPMTNQIYFSARKTLPKTSIVSALVLFPNSNGCWSWPVASFWICIREIPYLTFGRLWMAVVYSCYLNLPKCWSRLITVLYPPAWKTLWWISTGLLSMFCAYFFAGAVLLHFEPV